MAIPTNSGGWGPREGVAASAAGLGADQGVASAVGYGVMVLVVSLPGAAVLVTEWSPGHMRKLESAGPPWWRPSAVAGPQGAGRG